MADPLSIVGTTIAIIQLTGSCIALLRSHIGPSKYGVTDIKSMELDLNEFIQTMERFKTHIETHCMTYNNGEEPFDSLDHLRRPLEDCKVALDFIKNFLSKDHLKQIFLGAKFDRRIGRALASLKKARQLFVDVIVLNTNASSLRLEQRVESLRKDIQGLHDFVKNSQNPDPELLSHYRDRIKKWLVPRKESDIDYHEQLDRHIRARAAGSCNWLWQHDLYDQWLHKNEAPPVIWVQGPLGLGKSVLCSAAIEHARRHKKCTIFYYCRFNNQSTVMQVAGRLIEQLFDYLFARDESIALSAIGITKDTSSLTTDGLLKMAKHLIQELQSLEGQKSAGSPSLLMFLDGLDEEPREEETLSPFAFKLLGEFPSVVRIWVTSRPSRQLNGLLSRYPTIHLKEHTRNDVRAYIESEMRESTEGLFDNDEFIENVLIPRLLQRCECNFLFARLLTGYMKEGSFRPSELPRVIQEELPIDVSDIYKRIFKTQYRDHHVRKTASELFSIVAFARRPLRLQELQEALALVLPDVVGANINQANKPRRLDNIFSCLIETTPSHVESDPFIQLTHVSVKDFLNKNPCVLQEDEGQEYPINEHCIANVCLRYLMQKRYMKPFEDHESITQAVETHHLLTYAAKYWHRHLDAVVVTPEQVKLIHRFIISPNFQTLFQVQSIFIEYQFDLFTSSRHPQARFRKSLPRSLIGTNGKVLKDYLHFVSEWKHFLSCPCEGDKCPIYKCKIEINRCLSGIMGPNSFLGSMEEKHSSFMLHKGNYDTDKFDPGVADHFSSDGRMAAVVSLKPANIGELYVIVDIWDLWASNPPIHSGTVTVKTDEKRSGWFLYSAKPRKVTKRLSHPESISFSSDHNFLRIGSQLFYKDGGNYKKAITIEDSNTDIARYFEEFSSSNNIIAIARRQNRKEEDMIELDLTDSGIEIIGNDLHEWHSNNDSTPVAGGGSDSEADDDYSSGSDAATLSDKISDESDVEDVAEESISEGSTQDASDPDLSVGLTDNSSEPSDNYSEDSRAEVIISHGQLLADLTGYVEECSDDEEEHQATLSMLRPRRSTKARNSSKGQGLISILDLNGERPQQIFRFEYELPVMLYHSPPAIHPSKPLVVWPLCGGDILFIDYRQNTYFIRRVLATTRFTRHVCMKVHFSECGRFMHIATIEAQDKRKVKLEATEEKAPKELGIAVFVTTHRLSEHKTSRSPPTLIHRVKAKLGDVACFSISKLPITFTWTEQHVYVTQSSCRLSVIRIELFRPRGVGFPSGSLPTTPRETVLLPATAQQREVRYFPPTSGESRGMILIGSRRRHPAVEILPTRSSHIEHDARCSPYQFQSPPIGIYIDEADFGGWVPVGMEEKITNKYRNGELIRKFEAFDAEDDCDLEDFISPGDLQ
ncbi:uncharacterized protein F4807DRAFT_468798 [Annulohypoxylon truncatum]|uniref:uncharacterized protein n=1 Tax=Annulohypoxylon truncatum TaxID=327061 RepID=UPI0020088FB7|nr:uncharacterized protein F4807DRAFT_468798 [Annulohypoxylon truncatum]KAI1208212.1 hypothetical protein F4807DRAFT_468798 [Annulohypoxylon truncatum]